MNAQTNVVIVGSGVAGSFLGNWLADQGLGVLMLEAGPPIPMANPTWWFHHVAQGGGTANTPYAACYDLPGDISATGLQPPWSIVGGRLFGAGGTTLHWGGWTPRFKPEDFALFSNTGQGIDWPFDYAALEPFYCMAEAYLGVSGDSSDTDPPRSQPYPYGAAAYPISAGPFIAAFQAMGISYGHLPVARYGKSQDGQGPCRTTGTCDYCPVGGRFTSDQPLGRLQAKSGVSVQFNAPVVRVRMSSKQIAAGVTYRDPANGALVDVDASAVILCGGALETPKLLIGSACASWPKGIGNDSDLVGRFLSATQFFYASGTMANPLAYQEELGFPSLYSRAFDTPAQQQAGKLFLTMNYESPNLDIAALMATGASVAAINAARTAPAKFQVYGNLSAIPQHANRVTPASGQNRYGLARTALDTPAPLYNAAAAEEYQSIMQAILGQMGCTSLGANTYPQRGDHASCTTRMANDASQGVVNQELQIIGTDNLYVLGNSVLPTLPAANPTLTLIALAFKMLGNPQGALVRQAADLAALNTLGKPLPTIPA
jgi:choline dehydrogenase-like flavoprotein